MIAILKLFKKIIIFLGIIYFLYLINREILWRISWSLVILKNIETFTPIIFIIFLIDFYIDIQQKETKNFIKEIPEITIQVKEKQIDVPPIWTLTTDLK
jgi:hypothetical protein